MKIEIEIPDDFVSRIYPLYRKLLDYATSNPKRHLEWDEVSEARNIYYDIVGSNEKLNMLAYINEQIEREFARGQRCRVCGMTPEQSAAIGYDCAREC